MPRSLFILVLLLAAGPLAPLLSQFAGSHGVILSATNAALIPRCMESAQRDLYPGDLVRAAVAECPPPAAREVSPADTVVVNQNGFVEWALCGARRVVRLSRPGRYPARGPLGGAVLVRSFTVDEVDLCVNTGAWLFDEVLDAGVQSFQLQMIESLKQCSGAPDVPPDPEAARGSELEVLARAQVAEAAARRERGAETGRFEPAIQGYRALAARWPRAAWIGHKLTQLELFRRLSERLRTQKQSVAAGISIGISDFLNHQKDYIPERNLPLPANDAEAFDRYFSVLGIPAELRVVRNNKKGGQQNRATLARILAALASWACKGGGPGSTAVVFVSSHGSEEADNSYIVPEDGFAANARITAISARHIAAALSTFQRSFLFIDACRTQKAQPQFDAIGSYLAGMPRPANKTDFLLQSTTPGSNSQTRLEPARARCAGIAGNSPLSCATHPETGNGDFTFHVLSLLSGPRTGGAPWTIGSFLEQLGRRFAGRPEDSQVRERWLSGPEDRNAPLVFKPGVSSWRPPRSPTPGLRFVPAWFQQSGAPDAVVEEALSALRRRIESGELRPGDARLALEVLGAARGRASLREPLEETRLTIEDAGQLIIRRYLEGDDIAQTRDDFTLGAALYSLGLAILPDSAMYESRRLFCEARAQIFRLAPEQDLEARRRRLEDEILPRLRDAQRLDPEAAYTLNAMGIAYLESGRYEEARQAFTDAVRRQPEWAYPRHNLALTYMQAGRMRDTVAAYREAQLRAPNYSYLHFNLALVHQRLNQRAEARREYAETGRILTRLGARNPDERRRQRAQLLNAMGTLMAQQGKESDARRYYEQAKQEMAAARGGGAADWLEPMHNLALLGSREAKAAALRALAKSTGYLPTRLALADLLMQSKLTADRTEAVVLLNEIVRDRPLLAGGHLSLAALHLRDGRPGDALASAQRAASLSPTSWEPKLMLARAASAGRRQDEAAQWRDQALALAGEDELARKRIRKLWNKN